MRNDNDLVESLRSELRNAYSEIDGLRETLRSERDAYREEQEIRRTVREEEWQAAQMVADDWSDAFKRGMSRAREERENAKSDTFTLKASGGFDDNLAEFWEKQIAAWERGEELYEQFMDDSKEKVASLEVQIAQIYLDNLNFAADVLEAEHPSSTAASELAEAFRNDNPSYLVNW